MADQPGNGVVAHFLADVEDIRTKAELADQLRKLRRRHARQSGDSPLTYRELAGRTGWAHGVIGDYFTGKTLPPTDRFDVLVSLLGATPAEIVAFANARDRVEESRREQQSTNSTARHGTSTKTTPRELPSPVPRFTGRVAQLVELDNADSPVVVVSGAAGVGKTALVLEWARQVGEQFEDGCLHIDLRGHSGDGIVAPADALATLLCELGVPPQAVPTGPAEREARYHDLLAARHLLLVLDDAHGVEQLRPLLPSWTSCRVVVTSRDPLTALLARPWVHRIELDPLSLDDSVALLMPLIGRRAAADQSALRSLAVSCRGVPLALRIAAEYVLAHPETPPAVLAQDWSTLAFGWAARTSDAGRWVPGTSEV
jgi:hypothetical protein